MYKTSENTFIRIGRHMLIWVELIAFPYFMWVELTAFPDFIWPTELFSSSNTELAHAWLPLTEFIFIFYLNYLFLVDGYVFKKKDYAIFIYLNIFVVILFRFDGLILRMFSPEKMPNDQTGIDKASGHHSDFGSLLKNIMALFIPALFALGIRTIQKLDSLDAGEKGTESTESIS